MSAVSHPALAPAVDMLPLKVHLADDGDGLGLTAAGGTTISITEGLVGSRLVLKKAMERFGRVEVCHTGNRQNPINEPRVRLGQPRQQVNPWVRFSRATEAQAALEAINSGQMALDGGAIRAEYKRGGAPPPPVVGRSATWGQSRRVKKEALLGPSMGGRERNFELASRDSGALVKVHLADDGSRAASSDTWTGSDRDCSDTASDAAEPWPVLGVGLPPGLSLPPGLGPPPGLGLEEGAAAAAKRRTPLRSQAGVYSPLRSQAEAFVPKCLALAGGARPRLGGADPKAPKWTTVMIRSVPLWITCDSLIDLLETTGFSKWVDFVYVPIKRTEPLGVGYAFLNLTSPERAEELMLAFEGFDGWVSSPSDNAKCSTHWSICQGRSENISRYQNSPLMSGDVPEFYKPVLLKDGVRIPFPKPTRPLARHRKVKGPEGQN